MRRDDLRDRLEELEDRYTSDVNQPRLVIPRNVWGRWGSDRERPLPISAIVLEDIDQ